MHTHISIYVFKLYTCTYNPFPYLTAMAEQTEPSEEELENLFNKPTDILPHITQNITKLFNILPKQEGYCTECNTQFRGNQGLQVHNRFRHPNNATNIPDISVHYYWTVELGQNNDF